VDLVQLLLDGGLGVAELLLDETGELLDGALGLLEVVVGQLGPGLLRASLGLFPLALQLILIESRSAMADLASIFEHLKPVKWLPPVRRRSC
jgi:hypothetical protein